MVQMLVHIARGGERQVTKQRLKSNAVTAARLASEMSVCVNVSHTRTWLEFCIESDSLRTLLTLCSLSEPWRDGLTVFSALTNRSHLLLSSCSSCVEF